MNFSYKCAVLWVGTALALGCSATSDADADESKDTGADTAASRSTAASSDGEPGTGTDAASDPGIPSDIGVGSDADTASEEGAGSGADTASEAGTGSDGDTARDTGGDVDSGGDSASEAGEDSAGDVPFRVDLLGSTSLEVVSVEGGATWKHDGATGDYVYDNGGTASSHRALLISTESFQSDTGFRLVVEYTTGSIDDDGAHNLSFGLVSDETDWSGYTGYNPFKAEPSVFGLGVNLTADGDASARGLNYSDGHNWVTLDTSGTRTQFPTGRSAKVYLEIGIGGSWQYRIDDQYEASGVLHSQFSVSGVTFGAFDTSKRYRVVVYGQDDNGGGKSIQSIRLEKAPAPGERAKHLRGTWCSGIDGTLLDDRLKQLKTLDFFIVRLNEGATASAQHLAPHKLMESLPGGDAVVPPWGDMSADTPTEDPFMDQVENILGAGFGVKVYSNAENFVGANAAQFEEFVNSWFTFCDTDPQAQAFLASQPYHTGVWNRTTGRYEDATDTYPLRKYMFCYAEFVLKEFALRYGPYVSSWIFDSANDMELQGDNATSGIIEEQRIYQAFADAVHAGNPDIPVAFNNGRSTANYPSYPFAPAVWFEDFTFGHAFGGNNNHADKETGTFDRNYLHIARMVETDGFVHAGGRWDWDDRIVGNFMSKLSTTSWKYGPVQAWEQDDFNQWNLEALQAGGAMTWDGSYNRSVTTVYGWVYTLLEGCDSYLMANEKPGAPNWARYATVLPDAHRGQAYRHVLVDGQDFWDPEGDPIVELRAEGAAPTWLTIAKDSGNDGVWVLSGTPDDAAPATYRFDLQVSDASGSRSRTVSLRVL